MRLFFNRHALEFTVLVGLAVSGCQKPFDTGSEPELAPELAAELSDIETLCELPAGSLSGKAPASHDMSKISCAVQEAQKRNLTIGFISNPLDPNAPSN